MPDSPSILDELTLDIKTTALDMLQGRDNYGEVIQVDPTNPDLDVSVAWHDIHAEAFGPQVIISMFLNLGPREVDTFAVVGFALPHDGNLTVAVNHMDGLITNDNAEEMFPT